MAFILNRFLTALEDYFAVRERGSQLSTEVLAGVSTFLALSYIFVVNPAILANAGMDKSVVLFATIIVSAAATITMGLWARLPFVLAPGMEMNAYVAFLVVGSLGFTWQEALGAVFWSGLLCIIATASRAREKIIEAIPDRMKSDLALCVGVFLVLVAFKVSGILLYEGVRISGFGSVISRPAIALYLGLALILVSERFKIRAAVLLSIALTAGYCHLAGIEIDTEKPAKVSAAMFDGVGKFNIGIILNPKMLSVILILFLIDFYGSVAKFVGLTSTTNLVYKGRLPRMREALYVDGVATVAGASLGTSSLITYVESGVGISAGGRTGLAAVTCGILMLACFLIAPLLRLIPIVATTGALVYVAIKICPSIQDVRRFARSEIAIMILMLVAVIWTFAIDKAMLIGCIAYIFRDLFGLRRPNPYLVGSAVLLLLGLLLQVIGGRQ